MLFRSVFFFKYTIDLYTGTYRDTVLACTRFVLSRDCLPCQNRLVALYAVSVQVVELEGH